MDQQTNSNQAPKQKKYMCTGTCKAVITQEQYDNGLTKCGTKSCTMYGQPFVEMPEQEQ